MAAGSISGSSPWILTISSASIGGSDFGHAIGTGDVIGTRHTHGGAEVSGCVADALVVGGDYDVGKAARHLHPFPDMLQHGFGTKGGEGFTGKSGRGVPGWNHSQDSAGHTKVYHS